MKATAGVAWADDGAAAAFVMEIQVAKLAEVLAGSGSVLGGFPEGSGKLAARLQNGKGFQLGDAEVWIKRDLGRSRQPSAGAGTEVDGSPARARRLRGGASFWTGQAGLEFPVAKGDMSVVGRVYISDGHVAGGGLQVGGFNQPIPRTPLYLQSVEGDLVFFPAFGFNLGVGASLGPKVGPIELVQFTGNLRGLALSTSCTASTDPVEIALTGKVPPVELAGVGKIDIVGRGCLYATSEIAAVDVDTDAAFGPAGAQAITVKGTTRGWVSSTGANLEGTATSKLADAGLTTKQVISTYGFAACAQLASIPGFGVGIGYVWGAEDVPEAFTGCDLTPWQAIMASASVSSAGGRRSFRVRRRVPMIGISARAADGPPRLRVVGPRGVRIVTPVAGRLTQRKRRRDRERSSRAPHLRLRPQAGGRPLARRAPRRRQADQRPHCSWPAQATRARDSAAYRQGPQVPAALPRASTPGAARGVRRTRDRRRAPSREADTAGARRDPLHAGRGSRAGRRDGHVERRAARKRAGGSHPREDFLTLSANSFSADPGPGWPH